MKLTQLLFLCSVVFGTALFSFGQEKIATISSADNFRTENQKGLYQFTLDAGITGKDVALSAEYYTMYFTVDFNEKNHQAIITMKDKEDRSKHIICRFLISLGVQDVQFNSVAYPVEDFYTKFLRTQGK
jgi:hypothetical protein